MSTAAGEGILGWLDTVIATAQAKAEETAGLGTCPNWGHCTPDCVHPDGIGVNNSESVLRRCAADRKLLTLHGGNMHSCPATDETGYLDEWTQFGYDDACPVVQGLAEGYGRTGGDR